MSFSYASSVKLKARCQVFAYCSRRQDGEGIRWNNEKSSLYYSVNLTSSTVSTVVAMSSHRMPTRSDAELEEEWYTALYEEDCQQLLKLLNDQTSLWKKGWESEPERRVRGRPRNYWFPKRTSEWKGRTALHVAARRGCIALIDHVVKLCKSESREFRVRSLGQSGRDATVNEDRRFSKSGSGLNPHSSGRAQFSKGSNVQTLPAESSQSREERANSPRPSGLNRQENGKAQILEGFGVQTSPSEGSQSSDETPDSPLTSGPLESDRSVTSYMDTMVQGDGSESDRSITSPITTYMNTVVKRDGFVFHADVDNASVSPDFYSTLGRSDSDEEEISLASLPRGDTELSDKEESSVSSFPREDTELGVEDESAQCSMSLEKLLLTKDGEYKLDAFAIALVNGNPDVLVALLEASDRCPTLRNRYRIEKNLSIRDQAHQSTASAADHRSQLIDIMIAVIEEVGLSWAPLLEEVILRRYAQHRDFNFLPIKEYLFHFLLTRCRAREMRFLTWPGGSQASLSAIDRVYKRLQSMLVKKVMQAEITDEFRCFLWELQDGQGRRPLHVSVDENSFARTSQLLARIMNSDEALVQKIINARDGAGRTAWQRGAALGKIPAVRQTTLLQMKLMMTPQRSNWWDGILRDGAVHKIDADLVSNCNGLLRDRMTWTGNSQAHGLKKTVLREVGVQQILPLHSAILLKQSRWIRNLAEGLEFMPLLQVLAHNENWLGQTVSLPACDMTESKLRRARKRAGYMEFEDSTGRRVALDCVGLAAMVGDVPVLSAVLEIQRIMRGYIYGAAPKVTPKGTEVLPGLHIAAASGKYDILKMFICDPLYDPFVVDSAGNTVLHHAAKGLPLHFGHHLIDFVSCEQILKTEKDRLKDSDERYARHYLNDDSFRVEREGCINRLLQFGCDIWEMNAYGEAPYPSSDVSDKFLSWWYVKQAKEFGTKQKYLSFAGNAVSVTGALVATASLRWVQPSGENIVSSELQRGNEWMRIYIIFDTMSFYLAIVAIICSLVPTLPMPQQSMTDELRRTRRMVTLAVSSLCPSIICLLLAFGAAFLDVTEAVGTAATTGFIAASLLAVPLLWFTVRVVAFKFPKSKRIRKLYDKISL